MSAEIEIDEDWPAEGVAELARSHGSLFFGAEDSDEDAEPKQDVANGVPTGSTSTPSSSSGAGCRASSRASSASSPDGAVCPSALTRALEEEDAVGKGVVDDGVLASATEERVDAAAVSPGPSPELVTDEGLALADALREARAALHAARQFVTTPWDRPAIPALECPAQNDSAAASASETSPRRKPLEVQADERPVSRQTPTTVQADERPASRQTPTAAPPQLRRPSSASSSCSNAGPSRQHVNALHARFGEAHARARVDRAKSLDVADKARQKAKAELKAEQQLDDDVIAETERRRCAQRAASARRAHADMQRKEEEQKAVEAGKREADRVVAQRYASSAARRVTSERARREVMAREVLSDLKTLQSDRRQAGDEKGLALQARCEEANWQSCKPVVSTGRKATSRGPRGAPQEAAASNGDGAEGLGAAANDQSAPPRVALPRILPAHTPRGGNAAGSRQPSLQARSPRGGTATSRQQSLHTPRDGIGDVAASGSSELKLPRLPSAQRGICQ